MSETEKNKIKMLMRHQILLKNYLITIKMIKKFFKLYQKLIKENQNLNSKKALKRQ